MKYYSAIAKRFVAYSKHFREPGMTHVKLSVQCKHMVCDKAEDKRYTVLHNSETDLCDQLSTMETKLIYCLES